MSGGREVGGGDGGKSVLLEDMWDSLESENLLESEEKLGKKVQDGNGSGSDA